MRLNYKKCSILKCCIVQQCFPYIHAGSFNQCKTRQNIVSQVFTFLSVDGMSDGSSVLAIEIKILTNKVHRPCIQHQLRTPFNIFRIYTLTESKLCQQVAPNQFVAGGSDIETVLIQVLQLFSFGLSARHIRHILKIGLLFIGIIKPADIGIIQHVCTCFCLPFHESGQCMCIFPTVISIQKYDKLSGCGCCSCISSIRKTAVFLVDYLYTTITFRIPIANTATVIRTSVINQDYLQLCVILRKDAVNTLLDIWFDFIYWNNNRNEWIHKTPFS